VKPSRRRWTRRDRHIAKAGGWAREGRGKMKAAVAHGANAGNPSNGTVLYLTQANKTPSGRKPHWWKCLCCSNFQTRCLRVKNMCPSFCDNGAEIEDNPQHILKRLKKMAGVRKVPKRESTTIAPHNT
jgi:hypothetical protein